MDGNYDIIITGAGLVGTSLMAALRNTHFRIAVLETHLPDPPQHGSDGRPLALSYSSQKILAALGIWPELVELAEPIAAVYISEQKHFGALHFRAAEENVAALGYVIPFEELQNRLYQRAAQTPGVKFIAIQKLIRMQNRPEKVVVTVQTADGEKNLETELLVAADGVHSPARELLGIATAATSSDEVALAVTLELTRPHQRIAYERFTQDGVIAVLPLKNPQRCRLVWTLSTSLAAQVSSWPDRQLGEYLRAAMQGRMGDWRVLERSKLFPLQMLLAQEQIRPGVVLLGNAAHTLYPLAAQGFNLGLRDVAALAEILIAARSALQALGSEPVLKSYVDWRGKDQRWISRFTSGVGQLFGMHVPGLATLRGAGLLAADLLPPLKHALAKRLMGISGKCPKLVRGIAL